MIDNATLMIGIAFSSASLMAALLIGWMNSKRETYLVSGSIGIGMVVIALAIMGLRNGAYSLFFQVVPFAILLAGLTFVYAGSRLFFNRKASNWPAFALGATAILTTAVPQLLGYSGVGTIMLNLNSTVIMALCAREYWRGKDEARVAMIANTLLYSLTAITFFACAAVMVSDSQWIIDGPPQSWAEDANSIMSLVGLTGIGAITLTLHHARAARRHLDEANTDSLTGVLNRRALFARFPETSTASGLAVLMLDLDHFKQINDRLGHAHGDMVLQKFADVLRRELRSSDVIARLGGEEFCVIMPGLERETVRAVAERIRTAFAALALSNGSEGCFATVSAGIATAGAGESFSSVLSRADGALYKAKNAGRNQVHMAALRLVA